MPHASSPRLAVGTITAVLALGAAIAVSEASALPPAGAAKTVTAGLISRAPGTLRPGSRVGSPTLGLRTFVDAEHGFALASAGQAQYPAASTDGGKVWRTDGPALHLDAAQAPLAVLDIGAANRRLIFAYGGGQVIDATSDGGRHWYRALFDGLSMAVIRNFEGHLVGFIDSSPSGSGKGTTLQYVSPNGGRIWRLDNTVGGS